MKKKRSNTEKNSDLGSKGPKTPHTIKKKTSADVIKFRVFLPKNKWGRKLEDERSSVKRIPNPNPKYPGKAPIAPELLEKHSRGSGLNKDDVRTTVHRKRLERKEDNIKFANELAARAETLLTEESGFLQTEPGETSTQFTQKQIAASVDITAATKHFDLRLTDFGPYRAKYTRNGRHLLLGGKLGHVAAFDWVTKKLHCELNVMETVHDVCWLHLETMFAVAQKAWVYMYDHQGIELHCIKRLNKVSKMEFLPYHFLLATASEEGFLSWLDISIGKLVTQFNANLGKLSLLTHNPYNAVLCTGHSKGIVSMWSPNSRRPLAKMLCHKSPLTALHVDPRGVYMATSAANKEVKIWDIRKLEGPLQTYKLHATANHLNFSQKNLLAIGMGNIVEVYKDCCTTSASKPYLRHRFNTGVGNMMFCPFEDVLGVATSKGFTSLIVPGSGEPNFDALECNPYQAKSQRREAEVKALLEKIQPELIALNPDMIAEVDVPTLQDKVDLKKKLLFIKPPKIDFEPRNKTKGRGGAGKRARNKKIIQDQAKKAFIKNVKDVKSTLTEKTPSKNKKKGHVGILDRFLPQK